VTLVDDAYWERSHETIAGAVAQADVAVLMMVLVQLTGDRKWIEPPFRPRRESYFFADESSGLPEHLQRDVREAAIGVIEDHFAGRLAPVPEPSEALYLQMMRVCVAEVIAPEYLTMLLEEMGLRDRNPAWRVDPGVGSRSGHQVVIVGAGMSGICMASKLEAIGIPYLILEKIPDLGGSWYENRYPEVGCDVPNHYYSYSFRPNPDWSEYFSKGAEIESYFRRCASEFNVKRNIRFNVEVRAAWFDEARAEWILELQDGEKSLQCLRANTLIWAIGQLNRPKLPDIAGIDQFVGPAFHTARWPTGVNLSAKRVVVVGTGASAMQLARTTASVASKLIIFQRSAQWALPTRFYHRKVSDSMKWLLKHVPGYASWYRFTLAWRFGDHLLATVRRDPQWPHPERAMNSHNDKHRRNLRKYIEDELGERDDLLPKVVPTYPPYGKRMLVDNHWFRTLKRDNVELVTDGIEAITATGVVTEDGRTFEADVIAFATGFETNRYLGGVDVHGQGGATLDEAWGDDDSRAYLGLLVPRFPNMFCLYGPNTNSGHGGSIIHIIECQVRYVQACVMRMLEQDIATMTCRQDVYEAYNTEVDALHADLIWTHPGMQTWYRNAAGRVVSIMPFRLVDYWARTREPDFDEFDVCYRNSPGAVAS